MHYGRPVHRSIPSHRSSYHLTRAESNLLAIPGAPKEEARGRTMSIDNGRRYAALVAQTWTFHVPWSRYLLDESSCPGSCRIMIIRPRRRSTTITYIPIGYIQHLHCSCKKLMMHTCHGNTIFIQACSIEITSSISLSRSTYAPLSHQD